jgi:type III secretion protein V
MLSNPIPALLDIRKEILSGHLSAVLVRYSDLVLVGCIGLIVGMMIIPLPTWLLDVFLTFNITAAVTILMVSIYISQATQIASYPTLLLITTLYRLALDISATRLILLQADAGEVIQAFGMFVVGGNFVVGAVIFLIITLVQFIVITKGAERVAEVSARFTLDAMPGKQMSIDADMRANLIDMHTARARRDALARESQFYGAMDGSMKFVKGDAIAGIIITLINIIGGLVIGVAMNGMDVMKAVQTYSILTIGNGLVSQIPALLISISAGMVVTRVASDTLDSNLGRDVAGQLLAQPKAIGVASGIVAAMALIPGLPKLPFFLLAAVTGAVSYGLQHGAKLQAASATDDAAEDEVLQDPELTATVPLVLQLSDDLTPFVDRSTDDGKQFYKLASDLRDSMYYDLGVIFPGLNINGGQPLPPGGYMIFMNEVPLVSGQIRSDALLVDRSANDIIIYGIRGETTTNPASGKPAAWIPKTDRERALNAGLQVWDTPDILLLHLASFLKKHAREFLGVQEVQWMVSRLKEYYPALVEEVTPKPVSLQLLTDILQRLLDEEVSIRDLKTIFQALSEIARTEHSPLALTEHVRAALKHKICYGLAEGRPILYVYQLDPDIEDAFRNSVRQSASGPYLAMDPEDVQRVMRAADEAIGHLPPTAQRPVILTDGDIRRFVKRLLDYRFPDVAVLSYDQVTTELNVQPLGTIAFDMAAAA